RAVDEMVRVAAAALEAGAHAGLELGLARIGDERRPAFQDVDELVLLRVRVAQRRLAARREPRQVDAETAQAELVAQTPLLAARHAREERLGIVRLFRLRRNVRRPDSDLLQPTPASCACWSAGED